MRADLGAIYDDTITVINKLDGYDSLLKEDSWYKTVLKHCMWGVKAVRSVSDDGTVIVDMTHQVQIPESEDYRPYREWKNAPTDGFTISTGDYIVRGEVIEDITTSNIRKVMDKYEPDAFQVQAFRDATKGNGFDHSTDGILRFAEVYYVEG